MKRDPCNFITKFYTEIEMQQVEWNKQIRTKNMKSYLKSKSEDGFIHLGWMKRESNPFENNSIISGLKGP